ncbi:hypothetical protein [Asticcacaulis taihuensis]|uniref:hypothetical protein n=1 Tax=Asticcacaulis taihuensis TaxID=260084 RepID=UPI0026EF1B70|nr:hypothetical protein [Asticcacaulis taihuensis]
MSDTENLSDLAIRLNMSMSWTQKHWREVPGLPAPFIGAGKHERPRWRRADLDRYFRGDLPAPAPEARPQALATAPRPPVPAPAANTEDPALTALLRAAGG